MKKKILLKIICPGLAVIIVVSAIWIALPEKAPLSAKPLSNASQVVGNESEKPLESVFPVIPNEQVYARSETNFEWAYDVTDPKNIIENSSDVVRVRVLSADKAVFLHSSSTSPDTPLNVQVLEVMSGNMKLGAQTIYFPGGAVTVEEYLKQRPESGTKMGLADLAKSEQKKMYLEFTSEMDYDLKKNAEYIFLLVWNEDIDQYVVNNGAYCTFSTDKRNVKTNNELKSTIAGKAKEGKKDAANSSVQ